MVFTREEKNSFQQFKNLMNGLKFTAKFHYASSNVNGNINNRYNFGSDFNITDKRKTTVISFNDSLVISFMYNSEKGGNFIPKEDRLFVNFHINLDPKTGEKMAYMKVGQENFTDESNIAKFFKEMEKSTEEKPSLFKVSREVPLKDVVATFKALSDKTNKVFDYSVSANAKKRLILLGVLEREFGFSIINSQVKEEKPKKTVKIEKTLEYFENLYNVPELRELFTAWRDKYEPEIIAEEKKIKNSAAGKRLLQAQKELTLVTEEIKSMQPEFEVVKKEWAKERANIEKEHKDDLITMDELFLSSDVRKKALKFSADANALKKRLVDSEKIIKDNEGVVAEMKSKLKVSPLALEKKKSLEALLSMYEEQAKKDFDAETKILEKPKAISSNTGQFNVIGFEARNLSDTYSKFSSRKIAILDADEKAKTKASRAKRNN